MKTITIHIGRTQILKDVRMITQYAGDRGAETDYENIGLTKESDEVVEPSYRMAVAEVLNILAEHAVKAERAGEDSIELALPDNFNDVSSDTIERNIAGAITAKCIADWYETIGDQRGTTYASHYTDSLGSVVACLSRRMRPHRVREQYVKPVASVDYE